jgi:hypothetical protein
MLKEEELDSEEEEEEEAEYTPTVITKDLIAEQVYSPGLDRAWYLVKRFNSSQIEKAEEIRVPAEEGPWIGYVPEKLYRPLVNDTLKFRLVLLPDAVKPTTFKEAYEEGCRLTLEMYDATPGEVAEIKFLVGITQSSWYLDRYFPDPRLKIPGMGQYAPIVSCRGMSGGGKDRLLNAFRLNSYRPFYDVATTKAPSLYRPLHQWKGTLVMSEADFYRSGETAEVTKYLNSRSYGVPYSRQNTDNPRFNEVFENFGLTLDSQRRPWEDNATEDRTLPHNCEKSQKPIPTAELPAWIERGIELMDMLLYLRLTNWEKVEIDQSFRMKGVMDHRLTASILPLQAISKLEPAYWTDFGDIILGLEKKRRDVKAMSSDGVVLNYLWDRIDDGLVDTWNGKHYVGKERYKPSDEAAKKGEEEYVVPLQTSDMAEDLKWSAKELRRNIHSLQLSSEVPPDRAYVGKKSYRPIWASYDKLAGRLHDFVPNFDSDRLRKVFEVPPPPPTLEVYDQSIGGSDSASDKEAKEAGQT